MSSRRIDCTSTKQIFWTAVVISFLTLSIGTILVLLGMQEFVNVLDPGKDFSFRFGLQEQELVKGINPDTDFSAIEPDCEISGVTLLSSTTIYCDKDKNKHNKPCGCSDKYSYQIYAPQLAQLNEYYTTHQGNNYTYESSAHEIKRRDVDSCDEGSPEAPKWEKGETTACWHPSNPGKSVHKRYKCGNDECIKVLSPYDDADHAYHNAKALLTGGTVLLYISGIAIIIVISMKNKYGEDVYWTIPCCRSKNTSTTHYGRLPDSSHAPSADGVIL